MLAEEIGPPESKSSTFIAHPLNRTANGNSFNI
jgi:hypothetical protein